MNTKPVGFDTSTRYSQGKKDFNKLSRTEQVIRLGAEDGIQKFHNEHLELPQHHPKTNLGIFLKATVSLRNTIHNVLKKMVNKK